MKKGATVGLMSVFAGVLVATLTSVYACHTFHGGGRYSIDSIDSIDDPKIFAEFQLNPNSVQVNITHNDDSTSFQVRAHSTTFDFEIPCDPDLPRTVTITGEMESTIVLGAGPERQTFTETVPFTVLGQDNAPPGASGDSLSLTLCYSEGWWKTAISPSTLQEEANEGCSDPLRSFHVPLVVHVTCR